MRAILLMTLVLMLWDASETVGQECVNGICTLPAARLPIVFERGARLTWQTNDAWRSESPRRPLLRRVRVRRWR